MAGTSESSGLPWPAEIDELLAALRALGVHAGLDESVPTAALECRGVAFDFLGNTALPLAGRPSRLEAAAAKTRATATVTTVCRRLDPVTPEFVRRMLKRRRRRTSRELRHSLRRQTRASALAPWIEAPLPSLVDHSYRRQYLAGPLSRQGQHCLGSRRPRHAPRHREAFTACESRSRAPRRAAAAFNQRRLGISLRLL